ncbi:hypothetical protein [Legionella rowbothamii]|uniref:hypothetical protein n=1 Tax=Legionella rowbothamii TaxID=96229 RepID=UPI001054F79A|nr:hypothetical protein [Legionella rowbothamii]
MPKNNIQQQSSKTSSHPMNQNLFVFKFTPLPQNLDNDPSVMRHQFHLNIDKEGKLGDPEPVYKSSKKRSSPSKSARSTTRQSSCDTNHEPTDTPTSEIPPSLYNNGSSPTFFTTLSPQTTNSATAAPRNKISPVIAEKIKISYLVNNKMVDEKELDLSTIQVLAETFKASATPLESELSRPKLW